MKLHLKKKINKSIAINHHWSAFQQKTSLVCNCSLLVCLKGFFCVYYDWCVNMMWFPTLEYIPIAWRFPDADVKQVDVCSPWINNSKKTNYIHTCGIFLTYCVLASQILLQGKNPGVVWEYTLPRTERKPDYSWGVVRSDCSAPCAGGETACVFVCRPMYVCFNNETRSVCSCVLCTWVDHSLNCNFPIIA